MPRYELRPAPARLLILLLPMLVCALSACAAPIAISRAALPCSKLVPSQLTEDTPGAPPPADQTVGSWIAFGDAQTGQLDKANLTKGATLSIIRQCEARDASIDAQLAKRKKVLGLF